MNNISNETIAIIGPKGIPKNFPGTSGIEAYIENQIPQLIQTGNRVICYTRRWASVKPITTHLGATIIPVFTINTTVLDTITYSLFATIHASCSNTTVVWYHGIGPAFFSFIPKLFHKKVYTTIHSLDWHRKKWGGIARLFLRLSEKITVFFSDNIFVVSTRLQDYYKTAYHKNAKVIKYALLPQKSVPPDIIRRKYHLTKNSYVLYLGRFVPEKRIEWLIGSMQQHPNLTLVLSGGGSHSESYVRHLTALNRNKNIIFTGYVFGKEKAELFSNCRLFVLPSTLEGYPISVAEALAYGKRCLIGDFLASEYSSANKLIFYFNRDSYENFSKILTSLLRKISR